MTEFFSYQEHKKIVFFHPKETDIDNQIKHIGLCEAIVRFTEYVQFDSCDHLFNSYWIWYVPFLFDNHFTYTLLTWISGLFLINHAKVSTPPREDNSFWRWRKISGW